MIVRDALLAAVVLVMLALMALSLWALGVWEYIHDKLREEREENRHVQ